MKSLEILLLIEDNENDIALISRMLRQLLSFVAIVVHSTGESALDYLHQTKHIPQIIFLDLSLPGMDGFEFIRRMREIKRLDNIPVVIITGASMDIARAHAAEIAAGYLIKNVDVERLAVQFKELLINLGFDV